MPTLHASLSLYSLPAQSKVTQAWSQPEMVFAAFFFVFVIIEAFVRARKASKNPWGQGATTFEWKLSSPPPFHSYDDIPKVK